MPRSVWVSVCGCSCRPVSRVQTDACLSLCCDVVSYSLHPALQLLITNGKHVLGFLSPFRLFPLYFILLDCEQKGAVWAAALKDNSCKISRWVVKAILAGNREIKFGCVSTVKEYLCLVLAALSCRFHPLCF